MVKQIAFHQHLFRSGKQGAPRPVVADNIVPEHDRRIKISIFNGIARLYPAGERFLQCDQQFLFIRFDG